MRQYHQRATNIHVKAYDPTAKSYKRFRLVEKKVTSFENAHIYELHNKVECNVWNQRPLKCKIFSWKCKGIWLLCSCIGLFPWKVIHHHLFDSNYSNWKFRLRNKSNLSCTYILADLSFSHDTSLKNSFWFSTLPTTSWSSSKYVTLPFSGGHIRLLLSTGSAYIVD